MQEEVTVSHAVGYWKWTGHLTDTCAICRLPLDETKAECRTIPSISVGACQHAFHERCINRWLKKRGVCPLCSVEWKEVRG
jgi:RING-box protein 1